MVLMDTQHAICPVCERECPVEYMTRHHLRTKKADRFLIEALCRDCHSYIHRLFTNKQLAASDSPLNTVEGLLAVEEYARAVAFIRKLPVGRRVKISQSNERKRKHGRRR